MAPGSRFVSEVIYLNGSLVARSDARISALDYGFLYGFGLFETMRAYGGHVFRLERHLERLTDCAEALGIAVDVPVLRSAVIDTLRANRLGDARIRLTVSIGEGGMVPDPASCGEPTVLVTAGHYRPLPEQVYQKGFRAIVSSICCNSQSPISTMKSLNFLENMLARQEARTAGADEALFLNEKGLLAEASVSNVFLVVGGVLKTPGRESGILPGITREAVLELARRVDIPVVEGDVTLDELLDAGEAFLTNSLIEVMPLTEAAAKMIGSGVPGPVTTRLIAVYKELVRQETGGKGNLVP